MSRSRIFALSAALVLLLLGSGMDPSQSLYRENRAGNRALELEQPEEALKHYSEAQALAPDDPRVLYNLGLALARSGQKDQAEQAWRRVSQLAEGDLLRDAWFNRGVMAMEAQDPAAAARGFTQALMVDPADLEAQRNLELALRSMQQQPQQQQPQQGEDGDQDQDQDQQQQQQQQQQQGQQDQQEDGDSGEQQDPQQENDQNQGQEQDQDPKQQEQQGEDQKQDQTQPSEGKQQAQEPSDEDQKPQQGQQSPSQQASDDPNKQLAERLLEQLEQNEQQALRRALRQAAGKDQKREREW